MTRRERNQSKRSSKRALTSSVLAIVLCVVLLAGATFAWFTDTASTKVSKIESGTLDVELQYYDATEGKFVSAEGQPLSFANAEGNTNILWEPGATFTLPVLRVVNQGSLALKYKVLFTITDGDEKLADVLDVYVNGTEEENRVCTLAEILEKSAEDTSTSEGELRGTLRPKGSKDANNNPLDVSAEYTVYLKMQESAGNEYQDKTITAVKVEVQATQYTYENDMTDNQYDANAEYADASANAPDVYDPADANNTTVPDASQDGEIHITSAADLVAIMNTSQNENSAHIGKTFVLDTNIDFGGNTIKGIGSEQSNFAGNFDGNGYTISNFVIDRSSVTDGYAGLFNYVGSGNTIKNLTVKNATIKGVKWAGAIVGGLYNATLENCKAVNCDVTADKKVGAVVGYSSDNATVTNCSATDCTVTCKGETEGGVTKYECGEIIGFENSGASSTGCTATRVTVIKGEPISISTAADLAGLATRVISEGWGSTTKVTIALTNDIDMTDTSYTTPKQTGKSNLQVDTLTILGNGHTIKGLDNPLFNMYGSVVNISNLTIKDSTMTKTTNNLGYGAFLEGAEWCNVTMTNCHADNVHLTAGGTRAAVLVGYLVGKAEITNCTVKNSSVTAQGSVAGIIGHATDNSTGGWVGQTITNCTVSGSTFNSTDAGGWRVGAVIGTIDGTSNMAISSCTYSGNTLTQTGKTAPGHDAYGRNVNSGNLTIDGVAPSTT